MYNVMDSLHSTCHITYRDCIRTLFMSTVMASGRWFRRSQASQSTSSSRCSRSGRRPGSGTSFAGATHNHVIVLHVSCGRCGFSKYSPSDKHMMNNRTAFTFNPNGRDYNSPADLYHHPNLRIFDIYRGYTIDSVFVWTDIEGRPTHYYGNPKKCWGCLRFDTAEKLDLFIFRLTCNILQSLKL